MNSNSYNLTISWLPLVVILWTHSSKADEVDDYLRAELENRLIPGISLAVAKSGEIVRQNAYGFANLELAVPLSKDSVFQLASITKTFTVAAILLLEEQGRLSLDTKVTELLTGLPEQWGSVSLLHLITHTSGLPDLWVDECDWALLPLTWAEELAVISERPMLNEPGSTWSYNQTGYVLLGEIIERQTGLSIQEYIAQRFLLPLGLKTTSFEDYRHILPGRVSMYTKFEACRDGEYLVSEDQIWSLQPSYIYFEYEAPTAGMNSTAAELASWVTALDEGKVLETSTLERMWSPAMLSDGEPILLSGQTEFGLGWKVEEHEGRKMVGFGGGGSTAMIHFPAEELTIVVLTNLQGAVPETLAIGVASILLSKTSQD